MLKTFAIVSVFVLAASFGVQASGVTATTKTDSTKTPDVAATPHVNPPEKANTKDNWDKAAVVSNYLLVFVGILGTIVAVITLRKVERQTKAGEIAAEASLKQTNHIITSERAWMVVAIKLDAVPPEIKGSTGIRWTGFSVRFVNKGKTPAYLIEAACHGVVQPNIDPLPDNQPEYPDDEVFKWGGTGLPVLPEGDVEKNHRGTWANDPVQVKSGFDVLWVYGYVKYTDAFGCHRETWYCQRWNHGIDTKTAPSFTAGGPTSYNRVT